MTKEEEKKKEAASLLKAVDAFLSDKHKWTKGAFARDALGVRVNSFHSQAVSFCLLGAMNKVPIGSPESFQMACRMLEQKIRSKTIEPDIPSWNDAYVRTFEDVKGLLKETIETLEKADG
jgi:xylose isomerase